MATVTWDSLIPSLAPFLPNVPDVSMRGALRDSAASFLAQTYIWRAPFDPFETEAEVAQYGLYSDAAIQAVLWVLVDGLEVAQTESQMVSKSRRDNTGKPKAFWVTRGSNIQFYPVPDKAYEVSGEVVLKPTRDARGVEGWVLDYWQDAIISGAIYRMAQIPGKDWTNAELAQYHKRLHDRAIANARTWQLQNAGLRVQMRGA